MCCAVLCCAVIVCDSLRCDKTCLKYSGSIDHFAQKTQISDVIRFHSLASQLRLAHLHWLIDEMIWRTVNYTNDAEALKLAVELNDRRARELCFHSLSMPHTNHTTLVCADCLAAGHFDEIVVRRKEYTRLLGKELFTEIESVWRHGGDAIPPNVTATL